MTLGERVLDEEGDFVGHAELCARAWVGQGGIERAGVCEWGVEEGKRT